MRIVWLFGIAALCLFAGIAWHWAPLYPDAVALQLAFTPRAFAAIVHLWPAESLSLYRSALPVRFLLLACYSVFGYFLVSRSALFSGLSQSRRTVLARMLPLAAAFGGVAIALHIWLTAAPRFGVPLAYAISAACAASEWSLLAGFTVAYVYAAWRRAG